MTSQCADLRQLAPGMTGHFSCCVSNPPYFAAGPASQTVPAAMREDHCSLAELCAAAGWALKYGGDFFLVHRPERLAELITAGAERKLEAKRLRLVRHKEGGNISLILLQFRKGGKPGLILEEASLFDNENNPTDFCRSVYHMT